MNHFKGRRYLKHQISETRECADTRPLNQGRQAFRIRPQPFAQLTGRLNVRPGSMRSGNQSRNLPLLSAEHPIQNWRNGSATRVSPERWTLSDETDPGHLWKWQPGP